MTAPIDPQDPRRDKLQVAAQLAAIVVATAAVLTLVLKILGFIP